MRREDDDVWFKYSGVEFSLRSDVPKEWRCEVMGSTFTSDNAVAALAAATQFAGFSAAAFEDIVQHIAGAMRKGMN